MSMAQRVGIGLQHHCVHVLARGRYDQSCGTRFVQCRSSGSSGSSSASHDQDSNIWKEAAFPQYMQESVEASTFCDLWEDAKRKQPLSRDQASTSLWSQIRQEAERDARDEPLLSSFLFASILSHESFERSLAFILANRLANMTLLATELFELFYETIKAQKYIQEAAQADLCALRERDPACRKYSQAILYFKGYHALQVHRIAHAMWKQDRKVMAAALQSRSSEVFAVDIHPAAKIGKGVLLDHGTGVVIGETAVVGNNVSIMQNVTLGGTGKQHGDRHPKISDNVLVGASATILGAITIGKGSQVAAGSLVLKPVDPKTMVAGSPAKPVGRVQGNPALTMKQWYGSRVTSGDPSANRDAGSRLDDEDCVDVFVDQRRGNQPSPDAHSGPIAELDGQHVADTAEEAGVVRDVPAETVVEAAAEDKVSKTPKSPTVAPRNSVPPPQPGQLDSMDWII